MSQAALLLSAASAIVRPLASCAILVANHSSYPAPHNAAADSDAAVAAVLREQEAAGVELVTDGQLSDTDPVSPLLGALDGVRLGPVRTLPDRSSDLAALPVVQAKLRRRHALARRRQPARRTRSPTPQ